MFKLPEFAEYNLVHQILSLGMFTIGRLGVPIFFMMSGYLLLDKNYNRENSQKFYRKNLLGLVLSTEIWIVIYNLFNAWFYERTINVGVLCRNMLFLQSTEMSHMWYMPVIIGIYIFLPFIANALQHTDYKITERIMLLAFIGFFAIPAISTILSAKGFSRIDALIDLSYSGGCYGIYFVTGYFGKKGSFDKIRTWMFLLMFGLCFFITVSEQLILFSSGHEYTVWYNNITLFIAAFSIFVFAARVKSIEKNSAIVSLARCSFGIYLLHNPINMLLIRCVDLKNLYIRMVVVFFITLAISWGGVYILSKNRRIGKVMFFMK